MCMFDEKWYNLSMKKYILLCFVVLQVLIIQNAHAELFLPESIEIKTESVIYNASSYLDVHIIPSKQRADDKIYFEYGVVRAVKNGQATFFEILSTEKITNINVDTLRVKVPNPSGDATSTVYAVYLKSLLPNSPDSESFFITKKLSY